MPPTLSSPPPRARRSALFWGVVAASPFGLVALGAATAFVVALLKPATYGSWLGSMLWAVVGGASAAAAAVTFAAAAAAVALLRR